jgi:hypothetical protein
MDEPASLLSQDFEMLAQGAADADIFGALENEQR